MNTVVLRGFGQSLLEIGPGGSEFGNSRGGVTHEAAELSHQEAPGQDWVSPRLNPIRPAKGSSSKVLRMFFLAHP